jgi:hypothetical protein
MHTEDKFEDIIERELLQLSGYHQGNPADYDPETALFPTQIINFIQTTQPQQWQRLANNSPSDAQKIIGRIALPKPSGSVKALEEQARSAVFRALAQGEVNY